MAHFGTVGFEKPYDSKGKLGTLFALVWGMSPRESVFPSLFLQLLAIAVAGPVGACSVTGGSCGETAPPKSMTLTADEACAVAKRLEGTEPLSSSAQAICTEVCGSPYNTCSFDAEYRDDLAARRDAGGPDAEVITGRCPTRAATLDCRHDLFCIGGRATEGLSPLPPNTTSALARMAHLEAISVVAFERLARELGAMGAPESLVASARRAASDERRHAASVGRLAALRGSAGDALAPGADEDLVKTRDLFAVALENAREGCVRESYGALACMYAAHHSSDPLLRETMAEIAEDESRHAAFSWDLHEWAKTQLSVHEGEALDRAVNEGFDALERETRRDAAGLAWAGAPDGSVARRLVTSLQRGLA